MSNIIKSSYVIEDAKIVLNTQDSDKDNLENEENNKTEELDLETIKENIINKANQEANKILEKANEEADVLLEEAYLKAKNIMKESKKNGFDEGYNEGFNKGYNEGKDESDKLIKEANEIKTQYFKMKEDILKEIEKDAIELVMVTCEKILNMKLDEDKETIISIISNGLENLNIREKLIIRVSKEDYDTVELSKERILSMANLIEDIQLIKDNSLKKGDCIIETVNGSVDVSVTSQIAELKSLIHNLLNSE